MPSTRTREAAGFLAGLRAAGADPDALSAIVHGTTVGTNALLERTGARCGLIVTEGFGDVLDMRRRDRPTTWGLRGDFEPVVPRDLRVEVAERTGADGEVVRAVDPGEVRAAARTLRERGAESAVVVFLNAYASDANERVALDALREEWPNEHVGASSAILAEIREFERFSTTALNGYLQPVVGPYLEALERDLARRGLRGPVPRRAVQRRRDHRRGGAPAADPHDAVGPRRGRDRRRALRGRRRPRGRHHLRHGRHVVRRRAGRAAGGRRPRRRRRSTSGWSCARR